MIFYKSSHLEKPCDTERITQLSISPFQGFVDVGLFFFRWTFLATEPVEVCPSLKDETLSGLNE